VTEPCVKPGPSRAPVYGQCFLAVTGHSLASLAAVRMFERGGNLADAAVAASAVTSVVLHHAAGIGGDAFLLYRDGRSGRVYGLNASGTAPALASPEVFVRGMEQHGPRAPVVPGLVAAWDALHRRFGKLPWRRLFESALETAEGHPVSQVAAERAAAEAAELATDPGCSALYLPEGKAIAPGGILRQPQLGATLRQIAAYGAEAFYRGPIAEQICAFFEAQNGLLRASDLVEYRPIWTEPLCGEYRGHEVYVMPPNSCGALLLMQLEGLSAVDSGTLRDDVALRIACEMSAMRVAFAAGVPLIADPAAVPDAVAQLLSPDRKAQMRAAVLDRATASKIRDSGGTSCLVLADDEGNAVSLVQSVFNVFGAMLLDPVTGILFNNRMHGFSHDPGRVNAIGPGKRPSHTLCPVLVERDGRFRFAMATPGGLSQTLTNVQVLSRLLDCGMDVQQAVEYPRWCNTRSGDFLMEDRFPETIAAALLQTGHRVSRRDDGYFYGSVKVVEALAAGTLVGGADFRREGFALGC
jgi:gamma-glutamyltranspeptidase